MELPGLTQALFGMTKQEALEKGVCLQCKELAIPKCYSEAGKKEYSISGLCERCFDLATGEAEESMNTEVTKAPSKHLSYNKINSEIAFEQAAKDGNRVVLPKPNQLLIDIDSEEAEINFFRQFPRFVELIDEDAYLFSKEPSKSGKDGHWHIIVELGLDVEPERRVLFQLMLGSDLRRELLSYVRVSEGDEHPTLFIEKPILLLPPAPEEPMPAPLTDADIPY